MTRVNIEHHPWVDMTDEEMLRSCGLILEDPETNKEGIALAAILIFGTDNRIMSVLPQHMFEQIHDDGWNTGKLIYPLGRSINFSIAVEDVEVPYQLVKTLNFEIYRELTRSRY